MGKRVVFVGMVVLALSSLSSGLHFAVGQSNDAGHVGPGVNSNFSVGSFSPESGTYVSGYQAATSAGTGGVALVKQTEGTEVWKWNAPTSSKQYVKVGSLEQCAVQIGGTSFSSSSQVGQVHMLQTDDKPCGGIMTQGTHIVGIQAQDVWTSPCGFTTSTQEAIVTRAEQMQRKSLP
jgi:hypothetical protein